MLSLGGCLNLKQAPDVRTTSKVPVLETWAKLTAENGGAVGDNWVASFQDPALDALVVEALANNQDILAAAARRDQAIALAKRSGSALWPTVDGSFGVLGGAGNASNSAFLRGLANWELDLWGRIRYLTSAAEADVDLAQADLEFARQSIAAQVAETYYLTVANRLRLQNAQAQVAIQTEIDRIQQAKLKEGQAGRFESELSTSDLARFKADVEERQAAFEEALRALEVLLGRYPAAEVQAAAALPEVSGVVPAGLPAQLLERRPDIMAAKHALASAFYRTESARANLLPRIALTADGGYASENLSGLLNRHMTYFSGGAVLAQPLFDAGARFADIEALKAVQREALAQYVAVALDAFREVQNALSNEIYFRAQSDLLDRSAASIEIALPLARQRYDAGEISLLNFKQVQTQAYQTRDLAISAQLGQLQQRIELHRALGGSIIQSSDAVPGTQPSTRPSEPPVQPVK